MESECCASGSCEVCRAPSGYSSRERDRINEERDTYQTPWERQHERDGWYR